MKVYEAMTRAFREEGVEDLFALMGDANMHWCIAMAQAGTRVIHANHEAAAIAMADGYHRASGRIGVASVTSGPGTAQIAISLTAAVRAGVPMVVMAGDTPQRAAYHLQQFDVATFVASTGAGLERVTYVDATPDAIQRAFTRARFERRPIILSIPYDLQDDEYPWDWFYRPSSEFAVTQQRVLPDPAVIGSAADLIANSERVVVLAGAGAVAADARDVILTLAQHTGAILASSLKAKGIFEGEAFDAGIAGSFASTTARELFADADLVIAVGAGLGHFTTEGGYLFPSAQIVQIDTAPRPIHEGLPVADLHIRGDARTTVEALVEELGGQAATTGWRTDETRTMLEQATNNEPPVDLDEGTIDPRDAARAIDEAVPKDAIVVVGAGHMWNFAVEHLTGRQPVDYVFTIDFGPVGLAIGIAIGAAVARPDRTVILFEGDGGLLMHIQELETIARHEIPLAIYTLNDGAYSAEAHKLVARGMDPSEAIFGMRRLDAASEGLGVPATRIDDATTDLVGALATPPRDQLPHLFDLHISQNVPSTQFRRLHFGETP